MKSEASGPFDPDTDNYIEAGTKESDSGYSDAMNEYSALYIPTKLSMTGDTWLLADCYHSQVLYYTGSIISGSGEAVPLTEWKVLPQDGMKQPHSAASDGTCILVDDTENNRVLVYQRRDDEWAHTQTFSNIGNRPHYTVYDEETETFYVLSSQSGELYCFRRAQSDNNVYLTEIRKCERIADTYVRSFTIIGDEILFVSGIPASGQVPEVLRCRLSDLKILEEYPVDESIAGMVQIMPLEDGEGYFVTVSTDINGDQDYATMLQTASLDDLAHEPSGEAVIYDDYFVGGGTPYYISYIDGWYYMTEHRLREHSLWRFRTEDGSITDVESIYPLQDK